MRPHATKVNDQSGSSCHFVHLYLSILLTDEPFASNLGSNLFTAFFGDMRSRLPCIDYSHLFTKSIAILTQSNASHSGVDIEGQLTDPAHQTEAP